MELQPKIVMNFRQLGADQIEIVCESTNPFWQSCKLLTPTGNFLRVFNGATWEKGRLNALDDTCGILLNGTRLTDFGMWKCALGFTGIFTGAYSQHYAMVRMSEQVNSPLPPTPPPTPPLPPTPPPTPPKKAKSDERPYDPMDELFCAKEDKVCEDKVMVAFAIIFAFLFGICIVGAIYEEIKRQRNAKKGYVEMNVSLHNEPPQIGGDEKKLHCPD